MILKCTILALQWYCQAEIELNKISWKAGGTAKYCGWC